jgi:tryptophan 2,3-dioxygenase
MGRLNPYHVYVHLEDLQALWEPQSAWAWERPLRAAGTGLEVTFALAERSLRDERTEARGEQRAQQLMDAAGLQVRVLRRLLGRWSSPPRELLREPAGAPGPDPLGALSAPVLGELAVDPERLPFDLVVAGRSAPPAANGAAPRRRRPVLDTSALVGGERVAQIVDRPLLGIEDLVFRSVHEIFESWFAVVFSILADAHEAAEAEDWTGACEILDDVVEVYALLTRVIHVLDLMVMRDYHPVRALLKGSSGAQSEAALGISPVARRLIEPLLARHPRLEPVYEAPQDHPGPFAYAETLARLDDALRSFYFQHYLRAIRVQSTRGLGALNKGVEILTGRFMKTIYPELDDVRFYLVNIGDFEGAAVQGTTIAAMEEGAGMGPVAPPLQPLPASGEVEALFGRLAGALEAGSVPEALALFDEQALVFDPEGSRAFRGHRDLEGYLANRFQAIPAIEHELGPVRVSGDSAQVEWAATGTAFNGAPLELSGSWELTVTSGGRIRTLTWRWDQATVAQQARAGIEPGVPAPAEVG